MLCVVMLIVITSIIILGFNQILFSCSKQHNITLKLENSYQVVSPTSPDLCHPPLMHPNPSHKPVVRVQK
jgi:hypothetical protein